MRMKLVRSLPEMCAETVRPLGLPSLLSSSTLNTVLGKASRTTPSTSMTSSLDKWIASLKVSFSRVRRVIGGDCPAEQWIAFQKLVRQHSGGGGHMPRIFALWRGQRTLVAVRQPHHIPPRRHNGEGAGFVPPGFGAHQTAFYKVHSGSSQPWVSTSGPSLVMAMVCSK